jgi:hypothetical protein
VLLYDAHRAARPALAELAQVRHQHVADHGLDGQHAQQVIDDGLRGRLIELVQCSRQCPGAVGKAVEKYLTRLILTLGGLGLRLLADGGTGGFRRGQPLGKMVLHSPYPAKIGFGVQPESAGRPHRLEQAVPPLPGAQHVIADAEPATQLTDPKYRGRFVRDHALTIQNLDGLLTTRCVVPTV